ncbi:MAG: alpha/beta hydrolase [Gammaproteobacteria bacterium]|nr:alpha/beta hydrolase [Gammaproteobacteria bacterium]
MSKSLIKIFVPWAIFFLFLGYDQLSLHLGAIGALVALVLLNKQGLCKKLLFDWGSLLFFIFFIVTIFVYYQPWIDSHADLFANITLTIIAWISLLLKKPFTLDYAKQKLAKEYWQVRWFIRMNQYLTLSWASLFTLLTALNILETFSMRNNISIIETIPLTALFITLGFNVWFPRWYKHRKIGCGGVITLQGLSNLHLTESASAIISYRTLGHGKPLILLPSSHMTMYGWDPVLLEKLAHRYQLFLLDYPGIGASQLKIDEFSVESLATIVHEFIRTLKLQQTLLLGFAMGGWITQQIAIDYGYCIQGLILIASDVGGSRATQPEKDIATALNNTSGTPEEQNKRLMSILFPSIIAEDITPKMADIYKVASWVRNISHRIIKEEMKLSLSWFAGTGTYQYLHQITQPTLIITGNLDKVIHRQNSVVLVNGIQNTKLIEYPDAGHGVLFQHPIDISRQIVSYFSLQL